VKSASFGTTKLRLLLWNAIYTTEQISCILIEYFPTTAVWQKQHKDAVRCRILLICRSTCLSLTCLTFLLGASGCGPSFTRRKY